VVAERRVRRWGKEHPQQLSVGLFFEVGAKVWRRWWWQRRTVSGGDGGRGGPVMVAAVAAAAVAVVVGSGVRGVVRGVHGNQRPLSLVNQRPVSLVWKGRGRVSREGSWWRRRIGSLWRMHAGSRTCRHFRRSSTYCDLVPTSCASVPPNHNHNHNHTTRATAHVGRVSRHLSGK
jgi:hypothetical protein